MMAADIQMIFVWLLTAYSNLFPHYPRQQNLATAVKTILSELPCCLLQPTFMC